ncbi:MAG: glycerate kinase type-2 family protein [Candidatus Rokuibacteriota bacterium]
MDPRVAAEAIWQAALAAGEVAPLLRLSLERRGDVLRMGDRAVDLSRIKRVLVLGCGKAGAAMARAVEDILGDRVSAGFVVVKDGHLAPTRVVVLAEAGHPVPDGRGVQAASRLLELACGASADDLVIFLVSGGGSALTPAPAAAVTLAEKQAVTRSLLTAGATIVELNAVRKHLSRFKGGQLARAAAPALVVTLVLSDVIGDRLDVIASGPTAPDPTTFEGALDVLRARGLLTDAPTSVRRRLHAGARGEILETPKPGDPIFERATHVVIGNNQLVVDAAVERARALGYSPELLTRELQGEARQVAKALIERARELQPPACLIAAGEATVTVRGRGRGGRCQELALAAALAIEGDDSLTILAAGTDGTDGPTDAAGALVDGSTVARARHAGFDVRAALDDNDAYGVLRAAGDLIVTGPTNTNLLDLYLVVHRAAR